MNTTELSIKRFQWTCVIASAYGATSQESLFSAIEAGAKKAGLWGTKKDLASVVDSWTKQQGNWTVLFSNIDHLHFCFNHSYQLRSMIFIIINPFFFELGYPVISVSFVSSSSVQLRQRRFILYRESEEEEETSQDDHIYDVPLALYKPGSPLEDHDKVPMVGFDIQKHWKEKKM